jgi:hypothetical protein
MPRIADIPFKNKKVAAVFASYPQKMRTRLLMIRRLIYEVAETTLGVGSLEETIKWGSPSYLTTDTGAGTTIRIDRLQKEAAVYSICVHCQTNLVQPFRKTYGDFFIYDKNRGILLDVNRKVPINELRHFIYLALTYHLRKKQKASNVWNVVPSGT